MEGQYKNLCPNCFNEKVENGKCQSCGFRKTKKNPMALHDFSLLNNRYLTGKVLGTGGFGITYLAKDLQGKRLCAIKEYLPAELVARDTSSQLVKVSSPNKGKIYEHGLNGFFDEAKVLSTLAGFKGIVKVYDCFLQNNTAYLVMEYLEGTTLLRLASNNQGTLNYKTANKILLDVSAALTKVHEKGILHRDISPENIFVTTEGQTKLIDFGAARYYMSGISQTLSIVLKPGYAPPEQYSSKGNQGPWTDIYALACTFYYVFSGSSVPPALDRLNGQTVEPLSRIDQSLPGGLSLAIDRAMNLNVKMRPQNMAEFLDELHNKPQREPVYSGDVKKQEAIGAPSAAFSSGSIAGNSYRHDAYPEKNDNGWISGHPPKPRLEVTAGPLKGLSWALVPNVPVQIGRSKDHCEIVIKQAALISRIHCILWYDEINKCFYIQDCSRNGTYSGKGEMFENGKRVSLDPGDMFYLATRDYFFRVGLG
ncbi:MAG: FHA domain-containing serine/threonine-protein kinase [Eubacteriales bacterium]|nr:FHA domain-containing serine/threonine-protein kinase [Eubacteriales bacterium]